MPDSNIPERPSLEYDRKQARRLLNDIEAGRSQAIERLRRHHPRFAAHADARLETIKLSDAQLTIAREYGFASWPAWKRYVEIATLSHAERVDRFLVTVCSNDVEMARQLLERYPAIAAANQYTAAATGNVDALSWMIESEDACDTQGGPLNTTPLVYACQSRLMIVDETVRDGVRDCVRLLLAKGADPNGRFMRPGAEHDSLPQTVLYGAAGIANDAILTGLLLEAGADPNDGLEGETGETLYHVAEFPDTTCLRLVLDAGPSKASVDYCLGRAVDFERADAALAFIEYGADVELPIPWFANRTHLMKAIQHRRDKRLIEAMVARARALDRADDNGLTAYRYAVRAGSPEIVALLESQGVDTRVATPVDEALGACARGDTERLDALLSAHPGLGEQLAPLDRAVLALETRLGNRASIPLFLRLGIDVDASDMPALHEACFVGDFDAAQQLVELGASLTKKNVHGSNALGVVMYGSVNCQDVAGGPGARPPITFPERGYPRIAELLLSRGAPPPDEIRGSRAVVETLQRHGR